MRQYKSFVLAIQVVLALQYAHGGFERHSQPASLMGRGTSGTALFSDGHLWLNPAAHALRKLRTVTVFSMPSPFQLPQLTTHGLLFDQNVSGISLSAGALRFGSPLYREQSISVGVALHTGESSAAGVALHFLHLGIEGYGTAAAAVLDAGYISRITPLLSIGAAVHNVFGAHFGTPDDIPRLFLSGIVFHLPSDIIVTADLVKDVRYPAIVRAGAEIPLHDVVTVRAGMESGTDRLTGGVSFIIAPFRAEYGIGIHPVLGVQHTFGLRFEMREGEVK